MSPARGRCRLKGKGRFRGKGRLRGKGRVSNCVAGSDRDRNQP